jgi:hypothetical protein
MTVLVDSHKLTASFYIIGYQFTALSATNSLLLINCRLLVTNSLLQLQVENIGLSNSPKVAQLKTLTDSRIEIKHSKDI